MGKIIAVVSGKGGTGKTSFTANTGLALASLDQHVLCMDCDITLRNLDLALGLSDRALMDFSDVLAERCTLEQAVVTHEKYRSLDLLAAPMADRPLALTVRQLAALAREIREKYDWCLMDAPAGLGQGFKMAACHGRSGHRRHHHRYLRHAGRPAHRHGAVRLPRQRGASGGGPRVP